MHALRHSYPNHAVGDATHVVKTYQGPDADVRRTRERVMLRHLRGRLPVPEVRGSGPGSLTLAFLPRAHGQDLVDEGHAAQVLRACGELLPTVHAVPIAGIELDELFRSLTRRNT